MLRHTKNPLPLAWMHWQNEICWVKNTSVSLYTRTPRWQSFQKWLECNSRSFFQQIPCVIARAYDWSTDWSAALVLSENAAIWARLEQEVISQHASAKKNSTFDSGTWLWEDRWEVFVVNGTLLQNSKTSWLKKRMIGTWWAVESFYHTLCNVHTWPFLLEII